MLKMGAISINATSQTSGRDIAYFSASYSGGGDGNFSITKSITNVAEYENNKDKCEADYAEFEKTAKNYISELKVVQEMEGETVC